MAVDQVMGKPPKPRLSQSPSPTSYRGDRQHQINLLTTEFDKIKHGQCVAKTSNDNFVSTNRYEHLESIEFSPPVIEGDNEGAEKSFETTSRKSTWNDGEQNEDETAYIFNETPIDKRQITKWIDQVFTPTENFNTSSHHSTRLNFNQKLDAVNPQTLNPEDDILAQWRLRRRMEQARLEISNSPIHNTTRCFQSTATPFLNTNLRSQHFQFSNQTRMMSNNLLCLPTDKSIQHLPTKIYLKDVSIQCNVEQKYPVNDCQVQTNQLSLNDLFVGSKSTELLNISNVHEVATMTDINMNVPGTPFSPAKRKSVRIMARPQSRNVKLQTPWSMIPYNTLNGSNKYPMCKNVCISVDKTHHQPITTMTSIPTTSASVNTSSVVNYDSCIPHPYPVDTDSIQSIEEPDSWIWPTTASARSDCTLVQGSDSRQRHISNSLDNVSSTQLPGLTSTEYTAAKFMFGEDVQIGLTIARYMEENLNMDEVSPETCPEDEILQDLQKRRADCIAKMKLVMKQIHEREKELINDSKYPE
ncbi:unnamed protein product [Heterobilharzia americana]|nr:unnamed protein product [Heterobilharzia americana]